MWIFLGIVLFLALLITTILLLPIKIIIKTDQDSKLTIKYKVLFKTFGEDSDSKSPIANTIKKATGVSRLDKEKLKDESKKTSFLSTISDSLSLITALFKRLIDLPRHCKIKVLKLSIICAAEDAAKTAINYGRCCALVYPFLGFLHSNTKVRKKGEKINISCDYENKESSYDFEAVIQISVFRILFVFLHVAYDEYRRKSKSPQNKA